METPIIKEKMPLSEKMQLISMAFSEFEDLRKKLAEDPNYLLNQDDENFNEIAQPILENEEYQRRQGFAHHAGLSDYDHSLQVASLAYTLANKLGLDSNQVVIGALLHDFYYEDWMAIYYDDKMPDKHGWMHPIWALENAAINFPNLINERIIPIIMDHMLLVKPIPAIGNALNKVGLMGEFSPLHFPRTKEAWVVAVSDCASSMTKIKGKSQLNAQTIGVSSKETPHAHRVVNPMRQDFEIKFGESVLNTLEEPHLKNSDLVTEFALKSNAWYIKSMDLSYDDQQMGYFFLHQKFLLLERYEMAKKGRMNDTLDPLIELKSYYSFVMAFIKGTVTPSGITFDNLKPETQNLIMATLEDARDYLMLLEGKILLNQEALLESKQWLGEKLQEGPLL